MFHKIIGDIPFGKDKFGYTIKMKNLLKKANGYFQEQYAYQIEIPNYKINSKVETYKILRIF